MVWLRKGEEGGEGGEGSNSAVEWGVQNFCSADGGDTVSTEKGGTMTTMATTTTTTTRSNKGLLSCTTSVTYPAGCIDKLQLRSVSMN